MEGRVEQRLSSELTVLPAFEGNYLSRLRESASEQMLREAAFRRRRGRHDLRAEVSTSDISGRRRRRGIACATL